MSKIKIGSKVTPRSVVRDCDYFTAGKEYVIVKVIRDGLCQVIDDEGDEDDPRYIAVGKFTHCGHTGDIWLVVEE